jgi:hypothetical protein
MDIFFTAQSSNLHGSTLKSLAVKGYLNMETSKDGLHIEYYLNNNGLRFRKIHVDDLEKLPDFPEDH